MNSIDLKIFPAGGYGIVLHQSFTKNNNTNRNVSDKYSQLTKQLLEYAEFDVMAHNINTYNTDVMKLSTFDEKLKNKDVCFKLFFDNNSENNNEKTIIETIHKTLTKDEISQHTPYTFIDGMYYFFHVNLTSSIIIQTKDRTITTSTLLFVPYTFCANGLPLLAEVTLGSRNYNYINQLIHSLNFLNKKGIFHRDINKDNIRICGDNATFIDFGSGRIDDGDDSLVLSRDNTNKPKIETLYFANKFTHPFVYAFFEGLRTNRRYIATDVLHSYDKQVSSESKNYIGYGLAEKYRNHKDKLTFARYALHKVDCFALAVTLTYELKYSLKKQSGGFLKCFRKTAVKYDDNSANSQISDNIKQTIMNYRNELDMFYGPVGSLLYFDELDYQEFIKEYKIKDCEDNNNSFVGGKNKKLKNNSKQYIKLKTTQKKYLVRHDEKRKKYILQNKQKLYLQTIKGKYSYQKV
jgi:hypothetical protein